MFKPFFRRQISVIMLMSLLVLTFTLAACGGDTTSAASSGSTSSAAQQSPLQKQLAVMMCMHLPRQRYPSKQATV